VIVLEHRYWGMSSPFTELTTENMQYLTLENSIADLTNFGESTSAIQAEVEYPLAYRHSSWADNTFSS